MTTPPEPTPEPLPPDPFTSMWTTPVPFPKTKPQLYFVYTHHRPAKYGLLPPDAPEGTPYPVLKPGHDVVHEPQTPLFMRFGATSENRDETQIFTPDGLWNTLTPANQDPPGYDVDDDTPWYQHELLTLKQFGHKRDNAHN